MPLFPLNDHRHINTDQIADIHYTPKGLPTVIDSRPIELQPIIPSHLHIELRSREEIDIDAEEADAVWAAYKNAITQAQP
jgi:hypothetical protein